jgi:polar amino acid transport system substrate-binding protein
MNNQEDMMKKNLIGAMLVLTMAAGLLTGCGKSDKPENQSTGTETSGESKETGTESSNQSGAASDDSLTYILDQGQFIFGFDNAFPPMGFLNDDQENVGFDIDVAKEVAKRMGVELVLEPISWKAKEQELAAKSIDCIWNGFSVNEERKQNLTLSDPYMLNRQVIVTLADSDVNTLEDLAGKKVVLQNGSTAQHAVDENSDFKESLGTLTQVEDNIQAMMDLKVGGSDAVVMDEVVARYYMELDANKGQYKVLDESLSDEEYAIGFRKGDVALSEKVNEILKEMAADGTLETISTEWFGKDITTIK